ncbi:unnamed protein product [Gordionus sp. m RMFG-2023]
MQETSEEFDLNVHHDDKTQNLASNNLLNDTNTYSYNYSLPGIIHYLEHQWTKFEIEKSQWEIEKAELYAKISFLQGERKGQENIKKDMIRRIKMLEYALIQERSKYNKLKCGIDDDQNVMEDETEDSNIISQLKENDLFTEIPSKQGRQLLQQYLKEIGYADSVIEARTQTVRTLLGLSNNYSNNPTQYAHEKFNNENDYFNNLNLEKNYDFSLPSINQPISSNNIENNSLDMDRNIKYVFDSDINDYKSPRVSQHFFYQKSLNNDINQNKNQNSTNFPSEEMMLGSNKYNKDQKIDKIPSGSRFKKSEFLHNGPIDDLDLDHNEALNEFNFLTSSNNNIETNYDDLNEDDKHHSNEYKKDSNINYNKMSQLPNLSSFGNIMQNGKLNLTHTFGDKTMLNDLDDELANLNIVNDDTIEEQMANSDNDKNSKTWHIRSSLRGHLDSIRCLAFHPCLPCLLTASEDQTIKYWNIEKNISPKNRNAFNEIESIATFRSHNGAVLSVTFNSNGEYFLSGGIDGKVICWKTPDPETDQFESQCDVFEKPYLSLEKAHSDAVWMVKFHPKTNISITCSADGSLLLWDVFESGKIIKRLLPPHISNHIDSATSLDLLPSENFNHVAVSYASSYIVIFDIQSFIPVISFKPECDMSDTLYINFIACHPTFPVLISGHNDNYIRFFNIYTGKCIHKMIAHLDSVSCLSLDPYGLYLLTGSHDNSIRLWNYENKSCVQEITCHRKKFDEGVNSVAFHPSLSYMASAGADSIAKIFVLL